MTAGRLHATATESPHTLYRMIKRIPTPSGKKKPMILLISTALVIAAAVGGYFMYSGATANLPSDGNELLKQLWEQEKDYDLAEAIHTGNMRSLLRLIGDKKLINQADSDGVTPLMQAAAAGHADMVYVLLNAGAQADAKNNEGKTAADLASNSSTREACLYGEALRQRELDLIASMQQGCTPDLEQEVLEAVRMGANPNARPANGQSTLLGIAVLKGGSQNFIRQLLQAGGDPNLRQANGGATVMHHLASVARRDLIRPLIDAGGNPMAHKANGATPLHDAIWNNKVDFIKALLPVYKDVNYNPYSITNGFAISMAISRNCPEIVQAFVDAGMFINHPMFGDWSMLIQAVRQDRPRIVEILLRAGADKNVTDKEGKRPIDYAKGSIVEMLR